MIIRSVKAFYIHIPKTGGHTISDMFGGFHQNRDKKHSRHALSNIYKTLYPEEWSTYYKFTFVRNPWEKLISSLSPKGLLLTDERFQVHRKDIRSAIEKLYKDRSLLNRTHILFQTYWLLDENGTPCHFDFIGRNESFFVDLNRLLTILGLPIKNEIKITFASAHRHYTEYYDDDMINMVGEIYKKDIDYLGYTYE